MAKDREAVITNGRAAFYACMWDDLRNTAMDHGWAMALHGSLKSDMDIMAMPWTAEAKPLEELIDAIHNLFTGNRTMRMMHPGPTVKPNNRLVYTVSIFADFYIDISVIHNESLTTL